MKSQGLLILDGGLATELEARGHSLNDELWSARLLRDQPDEILAVHRAFIGAGADVITTASYQATFQGFANRGIDPEEAETLLRRSVRLAKQARIGTRPIVQVAASVGPYGAFLANGAEYTGDYDLDEQALFEFHRRRWQILMHEKPDVMLCETIPSPAEAIALGRLAEDSALIPVWISFSCRDGSRISDGSEIESVVKQIGDNEFIQAVGVNCTAPRFIPELIQRIRGVTDKLVIVFPNSGETFDAMSKMWRGQSSLDDFAEQAIHWRDLGANIIGGCCRVTPEHIQAVKRRLAVG